MTRWAEARATKRITAKDVSDFIFECICCRFGTPLEILSDRGPGFRADLVGDLMTKLKIKRRHSTPYYPQCNGLVEKVNEVELASLQVLKAHQEDSQEKQVEKRIIDLKRLGLDRESAVKYYASQAEKKRKKFNRNPVKKGIKEGSLVLRYDNRFDPKKDGKFLLKWEGPFVVIQRFSNGSYQLGDLDGKGYGTDIAGPSAPHPQSPLVLGESVAAEDTMEPIISPPPAERVTS
ncbi:hypothetical protein L7F22_058898 [Adiantum nelumboides]|nr:hypothetical protein [Adiantum nelumboides]